MSEYKGCPWDSLSNWANNNACDIKQMVSSCLYNFCNGRISSNGTKMKKIIAVLLSLCLVLPVFSSVTANDVIAIKDPVTALVLSVSAAYVNVPKISLDGVLFEDGRGAFPRSIHFDSSDVSSYYISLSNPKSDNSILSFFAKLSSEISPFMKKAKEKLVELDFKHGDFVVDGDIYISGGDDISLSNLMLGKGLSDLFVQSNGNLIFSGDTLKEELVIAFKMEIESSGDKKINIDITECNINGSTVSIEPIIVSF